MLKIYIAVFLIFGFTVVSYGQMCGNGTYNIIITPKSQYDFKLFSLVPTNEEYYSKGMQEWILSIFPLKDLETNNCCNMTKIRREVADNFLKNYKKENFVDLKKLNYFPNKLEGSSNSSISFKTIETQLAPSLLRISSKKYGKFYFLGNFLGGCNRDDIFDISKGK